MKLVEKFPGIYAKGKNLYTLNLVKGCKHFDEKILKVKGKEYRSWDPHRSKLAAAILKGIKEVPLREGAKVLYLGAAHGYTISFISDIVRENGFIYGIEFSDRCFREFLPVCEKRKNIAPLFADARKPSEYWWIEKVDVVYVDIAQPDATEIAIRNCERFLKKGGYLLLAIKARSIDVTEKPRKICEKEVEKLKKAGFTIIDWKMLDPFEKDHGFIVARK
jgi:fibrillarin-like pre-rRNA processing protein